MSIYGNLIVKENTNISMPDLFDFLNESYIETNIMLEREMIQSEMRSLLEANELAVISKIDFGENDKNKDEEKIKKSVIQVIKEIWEKFVNWASEMYKKLYDAVHNFYMEHNFTDDFFQKFKDVVTWDNLSTAIKNGWKGIPKTVLCLVRVPTPFTDSNYKKDLADNIKIEQIDEIIRADSLEDAKNIYNSFIKSIEKFKDLNTNDDSDSIKIRANGGYFGIGKENLIFGINEPNKYKDYYYPTGILFSNTVKFALSGQKYIKQYVQDGNAQIKDIKNLNTTNLDNVAIIKKEETEHEIKQISILYWKAKYKLQDAVIRRVSYSLKNCIKICKDGYKYSLQVYSLMLLGVKRYYK